MKLMYAIWKYNLSERFLNGGSYEIELELPPGAKIIHVGTQLTRGLPEVDGIVSECIMLWARVEMSRRGKLEKRKFAILATGEKYELKSKEDFEYYRDGKAIEVSIDTDMLHLGTVQTRAGFVFHIFEIVARCDRSLFSDIMELGGFKENPKCRIIPGR